MSTKIINVSKQTISKIIVSRYLNVHTRYYLTKSYLNLMKSTELKQINILTLQCCKQSIILLTEK